MNHSLKQVRDLTTQAYKRINWDVTPVQTNPTISVLSQANILREVVEVLDELNLFQDQVSILKESDLYKHIGDRIKISTGNANTINHSALELQILLKNFTQVLSQVLPYENSNSVNIKLPPVSDFGDLSSYARDFDLALTQVLYLSEINSKVIIENVENGSIWLNVLIDSTLAVSVVGAMVWSGAVIYKKILEGRMMVEQLRGLKVRTDSMEDVAQAQKESLSQLVQAEADHINSTTFKDNVPDNIERIKGSIKLFAELLDKGAEVHPAIGAPEEVTNLYPNMKALPTIESKTKLLS